MVEFEFKCQLSNSDTFNQLLVVRIVLTVAASFLLFYIVGQHPYSGHPKSRMTPPFHWPTSVVKSAAVSPCPRCSCDCLPQRDSVPVPSDCAENHPEMNEEMKNDTITLPSEEINLRKNVTRNYIDSIEQSIMDVKQISSKYQEAEKCSTGVQFCAEARESADAALAKELKFSAPWEQQAHEFGRKDESM